MIKINYGYKLSGLTFKFKLPGNCKRKDSKFSEAEFSLLLVFTI